MVIFDNGHLNILPESCSEKTFGNVGGQLVCCKECKTSDMINVKSKLCRCGKARPHYGHAGGIAVCCSQCKMPDMVDVKNRKCQCGKAIPCFGYVDRKAICCQQCKTPGMIKLTNQRSVEIYSSNVAWLDQLLRRWMKQRYGSINPLHLL